MGNVTLKDEYQMLLEELRQIRQIQLQIFLVTPIWLSLFFGLVFSGKDGTMLTNHPYLILIPIVLFIPNILIILNRRRSADVIISYIRVGFDGRKLEKLGPGWHKRVPEFRKEMRNQPKPSERIKFRIEFTFLVWLSYLIVSIVCLFVLYNIELKVLDLSKMITWCKISGTLLVIVFFTWSGDYICRSYPKKIKSKMIPAWDAVL